MATSPPVVQHVARPASGRAPRRNTGNHAARTARALSPDSRCYVCTEGDEPGSRLTKGACDCGLAVHARCIQKWINAFTNNHGQVVIHDRDTCSACKGKLDMQEIDRVAREDVRELGTPSLAVERGTPAPIRRAIEGCNAAVRHRMICNSTSMPAEPYRVNNALSTVGDDTRRSRRRSDPFRARRACPGRFPTSSHIRRRERAHRRVLVPRVEGEMMSVDPRPRCPGFLRPVPSAPC